MQLRRRRLIPVRRYLNIGVVADSEHLGAPLPSRTTAALLHRFQQPRAQKRSRTPIRPQQPSLPVLHSPVVALLVLVPGGLGFKPGRPETFSRRLRGCRESGHFAGAREIETASLIDYRVRRRRVLLLTTYL